SEAVFEIQFAEQPHIGYLDGYLTIGPRGPDSWHETPDWARLDLWMRLRERYAGLPAEPPPVGVDPPQMH
ncbi:MAG: hypothetical protein HY002_15015, partial [Candidatus Rokubacteria bacterium]|nr:hypothetical protein [Candidatus Rokubacteria bacterium]